jgi:hypothetical protein
MPLRGCKPRTEGAKEEESRRCVCICIGCGGFIRGRVEVAKALPELEAPQVDAQRLSMPPLVIRLFPLWSTWLPAAANYLMSCPLGAAFTICKCKYPSLMNQTCAMCAGCPISGHLCGWFCRHRGTQTRRGSSTCRTSSNTLKKQVIDTAAVLLAIN